MSRRLTTTIGHRVVRAEESRTKPRQGHLVTLAVVAAIGIAAGTVLVLATDSSTSDVLQTADAETRHVVSSVAGRVAAYPLPDKQPSMAEAGSGTILDKSAELTPAPRKVAISIVAGEKKNPRLADTAIVTASTDAGQSRDVSLPKPAPARFGGALPVDKSGELRMQIEAARDNETNPETANSGSGVPDGQPVDVTETETAALEVRREPEVSASELSEPVNPAAGSGQPLSKGRVTKFANLRSGPDNDAPVLAVIPPNAKVLAQGNCVHWCRATYKGQKGYIYKGLIRRPGKSARTVRSSARKSANGTQASVSKPAETAGQNRLVEIGR